jgi:hypothetical protein
MFSEKNEPDDHDNDSHHEHEDGYPVDPVHIPHPLGIWLFRVSFLYVEILSYLS